MESLQLVPVVDNILDSCAENKSLSSLVHYLHTMLYTNLENSDSVLSDLIDPEFLNEIMHINDYKDLFVYFGKSLRFLKIVFQSEASLREIEVFIQYKGPKKICVTDANLPPSPLQDKEYSSLTELVNTFMDYIDSLLCYFHELERIDRFCTVMEPAKPTFRDVFRRILLGEIFLILNITCAFIEQILKSQIIHNLAHSKDLQCEHVNDKTSSDDRTWLHVRVSPKGFATDIHLVGNADQWTEKLQLGLLNWDHDMDIVENITAVFDVWNFPTQPKSPEVSTSLEKAHGVSEEVVCSICFCSEQQEAPNVPQPLCLNAKCTAFFHRNCLFQWLLACSGGRLPAFGVATGSCPACYESTTCSEKDT